MDADAVAVTSSPLIPDYLTKSPVGAVNPPVQSRPQVLPFGELTWEKFEQLCYRLASTEAEVEHCQLYGVRGQSQEGIDLYAKFRGSEKYTVYQCKRENDFGPQKIRDAVQRFIAGSWLSRSERFVLCTKEPLTSRQRAEAIEEQRQLLKQSDVELAIWDSVRLSLLLKSHRDLVADFFGPAWADAFCGRDPPNGDLSVGTLLGNLNGKLTQLLRELRWREASTVAKELERVARQLQNPSNDLCEAWLLLAELEFHGRAQQKDDCGDVDVSRFRELLDRAAGARTHSPLADHESRLASQSALLIELTRGPDEALRFLGTPTDVRRVRAVLGICLRANRDREAVDFIRNRVPEEKWLDLATLLFARLGEIDRANELIARADEATDVSVTWRSRLAFADGVFDRWRRTDETRTPFGSDEWSEDDRRLARTTLEILDPLRASVRSKRGIQGELEEQALGFAVLCAAISGDLNSVQEDILWLRKRRPLPLLVVELALRRLIERPDDIVGRLRLEHPGEFRASYLAAVVERELFNRPDDAFEGFAELADSATTELEKEAICVDLFMTSGLCSSSATERAIEIVQRLRPADARLLAFLRIGARLGSMDLDSARKELEAIRDETDGVWWQLWAQLCDRTGEADAAQIAWEKASALLPHPEVVRHSVQVALDRRRYHSAAAGLRKLLAQSPNNPKLLENLAATLVRLGDFGQATEPLRRLVEIQPSHVEYRIGLAQCLARSNRPADGIVVLRPVCESDDPPLDALLLQSELLAATGDHRAALELLRPVAADHWDDPRFLLSYMKYAHAAGDDRLGSDIFRRLAELRHAGSVPAELMQETSLEQVLEFARESQSRRETLHAQLINGRLPWLWVEEQLGNSPVWAWTVRTQKMSWLSEERLSRAAYSVYATNGFLVRETVRGPQIEAIQPPPGSTEVVVDLSALLTLHQLKRLEATAEYFGKLILPARYGDLRVEGHDRFGLHQASREQELSRIRREVDARRIAIVEAREPNVRFVDEYQDSSDGHAYRLRDLIEPLRQAQRIDAPALTAFLRVAHQDSSADETHPPIPLGSDVLIDLTTLRTLAGQDVFATVVENLSVQILAEQYQELTSELNAFATARSAQAAHDDMWNLVERLRGQNKLEWRPLPIPQEADELTDELPDRGRDLDALMLARQIGKPLLADDRVLQVSAVSKDARAQTTGVEPFGSDQVLEALRRSGQLSDEAVADDFLKLMYWRYRFLLPSQKLLRHWASRSKDNLPGTSLLTVADYLHDCLRDPGLHCGFETTTPPFPMAVRFVTRWIDRIVGMLVDVWADSEFDDQQATILTHWVGEEFLPSCPRGLWFQPVGANVSQMTPKSTLMMAMAKAVQIRDAQRANVGLRTLVAALGVSDDEFLWITAEAIHVID